MSRTTRRKNYLLEERGSWSGHGKFVNLEFTTYDTPRVWCGQWFTRFDGTKAKVMEAMTDVYRPMDKGEKWFKVRQMHGESSTANSRSPGKWYRHNRMTENRSINKQELIKWVKACGEYEPMFEADPRNCWWDWS